MAARRKRCQNAQCGFNNLEVNVEAELCIGCGKALHRVGTGPGGLFGNDNLGLEDLFGEVFGKKK
jgi:ribosomal protein S27E